MQPPCGQPQLELRGCSDQPHQNCVFLNLQMVYFLAKKGKGKSYRGEGVKHSKKSALGMPSPPPSTSEGREGARISASLCI